jgi:hypothetical protein
VFHLSVCFILCLQRIFKEEVNIMNECNKMQVFRMFKLLTVVHI